MINLPQRRPEKSNRLTMATLPWCIAMLSLGGAAWGFPLDPVRVYFKEKSSPVTGPVEITFSIWDGGEPFGVGSGQEIYREKRHFDIPEDGFFDCWLGQGEMKLGDLKGAVYGLDKQLRLQVAYPAKQNPVVKRFCLIPIDNAYLPSKCGIKKTPADVPGVYFKEYEPSFKSFTPDLVRKGLAILYPDGRLQTEDGSYVDITGTTTSGVQEFFNYCAEHHVDGYIVGGSMPRGQQVKYLIWSPLHIPPAQGLRIDTGSIAMKFMPELGDRTGLTIDSCMMCNIQIRGILNYSGSGYALAIKPDNLLPLDRFVGNTFVDTLVSVTTIACHGKGAVLFDGSINFSRFEFGEINHGDSGVHVTATSEFSNNKFTCKHIHDQAISNMLIESGDSNLWEVNLNCDGSDPRGIVTGARNDIWFASVISRSQPGLVLQEPAMGNQFFIMTLNGGFENHAVNPNNRIYPSAGIPADKIKLGFAVGTPSTPEPGIALVNRNPFPVVITILEPGDVIQWSLTDTYGTSQTIKAPFQPGQSIYLIPGEAIRLTYESRAPEWKWRTVP